MRKQHYFLPFLLFFAISIRAENESIEEGKSSTQFEKEGDVYVLTDDTFDLFLAKHSSALVEFYAPW